MSNPFAEATRKASTIDLGRLMRLGPTSSLNPDDVTEALAIAMKEDPKLAARLKRINFKEMYNDQLKAKKRLAVVHELLESKCEKEYVVFEEYKVVIFTLIRETFDSQVNKIKQGDKHHSAVIAEIEKACEVLARLIFHLRAQIKEGWERKTIISIIEKLLVTSNGLKVKTIGLRLLLEYLEVTRDESPELLGLYANAINVAAFNDSSDSLDLNYTPITTSDHLVISPNMANINPEKISEVSINMLDQIVKHLNSVAERDRKAATFFHALLQKYYLTTFFPSSAKEHGFIPAESKKGYGQRCPVRVEVLLVENYHKWLTSPHKDASTMREIIFSNDVNLAFMHEILRQSFRLPYTHNILVSNSIALYRDWLTAVSHLRPPFMRDVDDTPMKHRKRSSNPDFALELVDLDQRKSSIPESILSRFHTTDQQQKCSRGNHFARMYMEHMKQVFEPLDPTLKPPPVRVQVETYKKVLETYRVISMQSVIKGMLTFEDPTWETLLHSVIDIADAVLNAEKKYSLVYDIPVANDLADFLLQTVFAVLMRSLTKNPDIWQKFRLILSKATRWDQTVAHWGNAMTELTKLLSKEIYLVEETEGLRVTKKARPRSHSQANETELARVDALKSITPEPKNKEDSLKAEEDFSSAASIIDSVASRSHKGSFEAFDSKVELRKKKITLYLWKNILPILGNVNDIKDPVIHRAAIEAAIHLWGSLAQIRDKSMKVPFGDAPVPPIYEFVTWFFQACEMPEEFMAGRALAFGFVCNFMSKKNDFAFSENSGNEHIHAKTMELVPYFNRLILKGLQSKDHEVVSSILLNSTSLFTIALPGVISLALPMVETISHLFEQQFVSLSEQLKVAAITILGSLSCVPSLYPPELPDTSSLLIEELKAAIKTALLSALNEEKAHLETRMVFEDRCASETHQMLLSNVTLVAFEELCLSPFENSAQCVLAVLEHLFLNNREVIATTLECLELMTSNLSRIYPENKMPFIKLLLQKMCVAIDQHIPSAVKDEQVEVVVCLFEFLKDWILLVPSLVQKDVCILLFKTVESALSEFVHIPTSVTTPRGKDKDRDREKDKDKDKDRERDKDRHVERDEKRSSVHTKADPRITIQTTAEEFLVHLLHHFNNFPAPEASERMESEIVEAHDMQVVETYEKRPFRAVTNEHDIRMATPASEAKNFLYFVVNDTTVVTFLEITEKATGKTKSRMITRDMSGKYTWDAQLFFGDFLGEQSSASNLLIDIPETPSTRIKSLQLAEGVKVEKPGVALETRKNEVLLGNVFHPLTQELVPDHGRDLLGDLLQRLGKESPELQRYEEHHLNEPEAVPLVIEEGVKSIGAQLHEQLSAEHPFARSFGSSLIEEAELDEEYQHTFVAPAPPGNFLPPFNTSKKLIFHTGVLNAWKLQDGTVSLLDKNDARLLLHLGALDRQFGRMQLKIAVMYVGRGQEKESEVLANSQGSVDYNSFVDSLGWEIDLTTHAGYRGGLEKNLKSGAKTHYYCTSSLEVVFHVATKMPTDPNDPTQLKKKRHLGNDEVRIVWNDHYRPLDPKFIPTKVTKAWIIINPLPSGHFLVEVYRENISFFSPLVHKMVVSKLCLGAAVRTTAINAAKTERKHQTPIGAYQNRQSIINDLVEQCKVKTYPLDDFVRSVLLGSHDRAPKSEIFRSVSY